MILSIIGAVAISASCAWDQPRGTHAITAVPPSALVDNYQDIPRATRDRIKARMDALKYDDIAEIRQGSILGEWRYSGLRDMHFGARGQKMCREVSLAGWTPEETERSLIYCEDGHCIAVPSVCRNVSRITRGAKRTPLPPGPMAFDIPPAEIDPLPVAMIPDIPEVEPGPLSDDYTPQTFARMSRPEPEDQSRRISAELTFWDGWARPLFWDDREIVKRIPTPPIIVSLPPVPGVVPPILASIKPSPVPDKVIDLPDDLPDAVAPVPEPGTYALMAFGLLGVWLMTRRKVCSHR